MTDFYYRTEAKGIQAWILQSDRLRELCGGSNILVKLDEEIRILADRCHATKCIAAAGGATIRFRKMEDLRAFADHWPFFVSQWAPGLQVVQAWDESLSAVYPKLGDARNVWTPDLPVAGPLASRSGRTGLPAVQLGTKDGLEDRVVQAKLARGDEDSLHKKLLPDSGEREFIKDADRFDDGYLAVIHIDGNGVGKRVLEIEDLEELEAFSNTLRAVTETAARTAFDSLLKQSPELDPAKGEQWIQARPIVLGGDDLTVIVHGKFSIPFTEFYLRAFETEADKHSETRRITASAGIAMVKSGWPFSQAHALAEDLCKAAKRELGREKSGMLFHRVTTADTYLEWQEIKDSELKCEEHRVLAHGPWLLADLPKLDALCKAAGSMPRGALRNWVGECRVSKTRANARWKRLREVADKGALAHFDKALHDLDCDLDVDVQTGWSDEQTPIPDALMWINLQSVKNTDGLRLWSTT